MSSETFLSEWPTPAQFKSMPARRFAEFCQQQQASWQTLAEAEWQLQHDAVHLVLTRLEASAPTGESA